jgi:ABC-type Fe3+-hydroxamate transport system substrate-binding protein
MVAGSDTFINDMLNRCGLVNVFTQNRYPELNAEDLTLANPDLVFLSSEPYPFKQKHIDEFQAMLPNAQVVLVDGEMFSWYGSRLLEAVKYFEQLVKSC